MSRWPILPAVLLASCLSLPAAPGLPAESKPGALLEAAYTDTLLPQEIRRLSAAFFEGLGGSRARFAVRTWRLRFLSTDFDGSRAEISAQLFAPVYAPPAERPVLVFGSGTTGIADRCAPSLEKPETRRWGY